MLGSLFNSPILFIISIIALVAAITVHEFAHAWVADRLGDPTARLLGRLTLNPLAHLDLFGSIMLILVHFGWGKPVPFDPYNLKNPRRDGALISLAGATSNLILAGICAIILRFLPLSIGNNILVVLFQSVIIVNVSLAIFNLIPIHPLDGFKVVEGLLPEDMARQWHSLESLGYIMLLILVFPIFGSSPVLGFISPIIDGIIHFLIP